MILQFFSIIVIIISITLAIIYLIKQNIKGIVYSLIVVILSVSLYNFSFYYEQKQLTEELNSSKSNEIISAEKQYKYIENKSNEIVNKFIQCKLNRYISQPVLRDSLKLYNPLNFFNSNKIKILENNILVAVKLYNNKFDELYNIELKRSKLNFLKLELVFQKKDNPLILVARGIANDSTIYHINCFYDRKSTELGVIDMNICFDGGTLEGYLSDMEDELLFFAKIKKCNLNLKSKCLFYKSLKDLFTYRHEDLFNYNFTPTFYINDIMYPTYRLFDYTNPLKICLKPTIQVNL